jgi:hypothetical protein
MLLAAIKVSAIAISFWIVRQPNEVFSWYNQMILPIEETKPVFYKLLSCPYCHSFWIGLIYISIHKESAVMPFASFVMTYIIVKILDK